MNGKITFSDRTHPMRGGVADLPELRHYLRELKSEAAMQGDGLCND